MRLLQLSDIHFSGVDSSPETNLEKAVRDRMLDDLSRMHGQLGEVDAVLLVGDIAARGKRSEYEEAASFLRDVCDRVGSAEEHVFCVPGNHDIDRSKHTPVHDAIRHQLRTIEAPQVSDTLRTILKDPVGASTLLTPLEEYNRFASRYRCQLVDDSALCTAKELILGDRKVVLHGVTSSWISDAHDSKERDADKPIAGEFQCAPIASNSRDIAITLCHHPLSWLRDSAQLAPWIGSSHLVLTGHEHSAGIVMSGDQSSLRIASGAVNPERHNSGWIPAYNVIELELRDPDTLTVCVYGRNWREERAEFGEDPSYSSPNCFDLQLRDRAGSVIDDQSAESQSRDQRTPSDRREPEPLVSSQQTEIFLVLTASPDIRIRVARELGLIEAEDIRDGSELDRDIVERAFAAGKLSELATRIANEL